MKKYKEYQFVVIPLSPDRYANRGFNQVEGLVEAAGFEYLDLLEKREERASSSKIVQSAWGQNFLSLLKVESLFLKKILLIDDIYTTGATINRVKKLLEEAGAKDVKHFPL